MRIRKRYQNPLPPPDLSSSLPPSTVAAAAAVAAPPVSAAGGTTGGKDAEAIAAAVGRVSGSGCGGGGGSGLHLNGRSTSPPVCLPFHPTPSAAAAAAGGMERRDLPPPKPSLPTRDPLFAHGHVREVPKREQDEEEDGGDVGVAHRRWRTSAHGSGGNATAPESWAAEASEAPVGHGGHKLLSIDAAAALAAAGAMVRWRDEEADQFPPKKRRGGRNLTLQREEEEEEDEEKVVAEGETIPRQSNKRRRRTAASTTATMAATGTAALTSAHIGGVGAPTAAGGGDGKKGDDAAVKEEGEDVSLAAAAALVDANRGVGNGKKRRSPAVLMEGSRCSRVNGRGWRCCQQTLVGYSLCEHHLGKGRLRSVNSVKCKNGRARKKEDVADGAAPPQPSLLWQQDQPLSGTGIHQEQEQEKPMTKRRNKIGMVKARSISSLLHQPDHPTLTTTAPFPSPSPAPATGQLTAAAPPPYGTDTAMAS